MEAELAVGIWAVIEMGQHGRGHRRLSCGEKGHWVHREKAQQRVVPQPPVPSKKALVSGISTSHLNTLPHFHSFRGHTHGSDAGEGSSRPHPLILRGSG